MSTGCFSFKPTEMGQSNSSNAYMNGSLHTPTKKRSSMRSPFLRRKQKVSLSATFTAPISSNAEALNINTATVEQLMTLPGISRQIAQQIFEHRKAIGGRFQRIDDLALVSGIGAEKLEKIRPDICVRRTKLNSSIHESSVSSRTTSLDSVISEPIISSSTPRLVLNVNKASVFQLQQLHEMNQEVAANLVDYRMRKGFFKRLDDLIKVKGMSRSRLGAVRPYLTLTDDDLPKTPKLVRHASTHSNTVTPVKSNYSTVHSGPRSTIQRKSMSLPVKMGLCNGYSANTPVNDIFELLGAYSHRPIVEEDYRHERNGFSTIRLTSWNLDRMCLEKSENLGVKEVVCRTILENRLSILCLQEVLDPGALKNFCDELNCPQLKRVQEWRENSRNWKYFCNSTSHDGWLNGLGFIYDADFCQLVENESAEIYLNDDSGGGDNDVRYIPPTSYLAAFKLSDWTCYVLNIYLRYFNLLNTNTILKSIERQLEHRVQNASRSKSFPTINDVFIVAGDFSGVKYQVGDYYKKANYRTNVITKNGNSLGNYSPVSSRRRDSIKVVDSSTIEETTVDIDLKNLGFYNVIDPGTTNLSTDNQVASSCNILCREKLTHDKIILNKTLKVPLVRKNLNEKLTGHAGTIQKGLHHMAIPKGWSWGGPASEFCPIWLEIYRRSNRDEMHVTSTPIRSNNVTPNGGRPRHSLRNGGLRRSPSPATSLQKMSLSKTTTVSRSSISNGNLNVSSDSVFLSDNNNTNI